MDVTSYLLGKKAGGGGGTTLINKNINANGTYNASSDNADGYKKVVVDVQPSVQNKSISANGVYNASDDNVDGYDKVTVSVSPNLESKSVTITENKTTLISTGQGYDGISSVSVVTNVPSSGTDWSQIGYSSQPQYLTDGFNYAKEIYDNSVEGGYTYLNFVNDTSIIFVPKIKGYATALNCIGSTVEYVPELNYKVSSNSSSIGTINFDGCKTLKNIGKIDVSSNNVVYDSFKFGFRSCERLQGSVHIKLPSTNTNLMDFQFCFSGCKFVESITIENPQVINNMNTIFGDCNNLKNITLGDTQNVTNMYRMFYGCGELLTLPNFDPQNASTVGEIFRNCSKLTSIPNLNFSKGTGFSGFFRNCIALTTIGTIKSNSCTSLDNYTINDCKALINFGGFEDLGEAYLTTRAANYSSYTLTLSACTNLTHDSLMNVINNLYDIATAGCNTQSLVLGSTNLAKLTAEEISVATNKGWSVS